MPSLVQVGTAPNRVIKMVHRGSADRSLEHAAGVAQAFLPAVSQVSDLPMCGRSGDAQANSGASWRTHDLPLPPPLDRQRIRLENPRYEAWPQAFFTFLPIANRPHSAASCSWAVSRRAPALVQPCFALTDAFPSR